MIAVTGAGGFLGAEIVRRLPNALPITRQTHGDLLTANLSGLVSGCEAVVNCAAVVHSPRALAEQHWQMNTAFPVALAKAAKANGVRRFVQISSVAAIGSPSTPYGASKLAADRALLDLAGDGFSVACLRPPAIYGPGVGAWFAMFNNAARRGVPLPLGSVRNGRNFAYLCNVVDAVVKALEGDRSGAWVVTDSAPISSAALYRKLLALHGYSDRVFRFPPTLLRAAAQVVMGSRAESLIGSAVFDGKPFAQAFAWAPAISMDEGLRATVASEV